MSVLIDLLYCLNDSFDSRILPASGRLKRHIIAAIISALLLCLPGHTLANKTKYFQCTANSVQLLTQPSVAQNASQSDFPELRIQQKPETTQLSYPLIAQDPHDPKAFTEGLLFHEGYLFESTGLLGRSELRKINFLTGKSIHSRPVPDMFFAEGLTVLNGELIQLSWKLGQAYVYQPENLNLIRQFSFPGEGWGITTLKEQLVISDGSSLLKFLDSSNLQLTHSLRVTDQGHDVNGLNELETVDGWLYANVWPSPCIVKINPENGQVQGWLNLSLLSPATDNDWHTAMNGIAYDPKSKHFFITGKYWPSLYEIKLSTAHLKQSPR